MRDIGHETGDMMEPLRVAPAVDGQTSSSVGAALVDARTDSDGGHVNGSQDRDKGPSRQVRSNSHGESLPSRLVRGSHLVEVRLPYASAEALLKAVRSGYVFLRFPETLGGTDVVVRLDGDECEVGEADPKNRSGSARLVGGFILDLKSLKFVADIGIATLTGHARLEALAPLLHGTGVVPSSSSSVRRVCVLSRLLRPGLGDLVLRNVFLQLLRRAFPRIHLTWIVGERIMTSQVQDELVRQHSYADEVITCPDAEEGSNGQWEAFLAELADMRFDVCVLDPMGVGVDSQDIVRAGIPGRVGLPGPPGELRWGQVRGSDDRYLTHPLRLPIPMFEWDLYDYATALARAVGINESLDASTLVPRLRLRSEAMLALGVARPLVVIHPGGGKTPHRRWPLSSYIELCVRIVLEWDATIVVLGTADEDEDVERLRRGVLVRCPDAGVLAYVEKPLNQLANLIDGADLLVGSDSGPAHIAAALGTRTVVIYGGSGDDFLWSRIYPLHCGVSRHYACETRKWLDVFMETVPWGYLTCPYACPYTYVSPDGEYPRCLAEISLDEVYQAVSNQLQSTSLTLSNSVE